MTNDNAILNASVLYTENEILTEFHESCRAEAEAPGQHTERLKLAAENVCLRGQPLLAV